MCVNPNSTCTSASDCLPNYDCVDVPQVGNSYCLQVCQTASDCPNREPCCAANTQAGSVCSPINYCLM